MANSFYNKITQKVSRGSGASNIAESIGGQAQAVGDSLKEQQASQDYKKSQAGNQLGSALTAAAGQALQAYGQAKKTFDTSTITDAKQARLNTVKAEIEAETEPKKQRKLIDKAMNDKSFLSEAQQEYSDAGHGGTELDAMLDGLQKERQRMLRGVLKSNVESMAKVEKETWNGKLNLVTNDVSRSYLTPPGDTDAVKSLMKGIDITDAPGTLGNITKKKEAIRKLSVGRMEIAIENGNPDLIENILKKDKNRKVLDSKTYTKYEKAMLKLRKDGATPVKYSLKKMGKLDPVDEESAVLMFDKVSADSNVFPIVRNMVGAERNGLVEYLKGSNPSFFKDGKKRILDSLKKDPSIKSADSEAVYKKFTEMQSTIKDMVKNNPNKFRSLLGTGNVKGLDGDKITQVNERIEEVFKTNELGGSPIEGMDANVAYAAASVQTTYGVEQNNQRYMRALHSKDGNKDIKSNFNMKEGKSTMTRFNKLFSKDRTAFNDMTRSFLSANLIGAVPGTDVEQVRFEAVLGGTIDAREEFGAEFDKVPLFERLELIEKKVKGRIRKHIDKVWYQ